MHCCVSDPRTRGSYCTRMRKREVLGVNGDESFAVFETILTGCIYIVDRTGKEEKAR